MQTMERWKEQSVRAVKKERGEKRRKKTRTYLDVVQHDQRTETDGLAYMGIDGRERVNEPVDTGYGSVVCLRE